MKIFIVCWLLVIGYSMLVINYATNYFSYWIAGVNFGFMVCWTIIMVFMEGKIK